MEVKFSSYKDEFFLAEMIAPNRVLNQNCRIVQIINVES